MSSTRIPWTQAVWRDPRAVAAWSEDVLEAVGPLVDDPDALAVVLAKIGRLLDRAPTIPVRLPAFITPRIIPVDAKHPNGWKGGLIRGVWQSNPDATGGVFIDGDTAIDPSIVAALEVAVKRDPDAVWAVPCRIWGRSIAQTVDVSVREDQLQAVQETARWNPDDEWIGPGVLRVKPRRVGVYSHRIMVDGKAIWGFSTVEEDDRIDAFGLGCTYIPWRLCEAVERRGSWDKVVFPRDDLILSMIAAEEGIAAKLVPMVEAVHLHWDEDSVEAFGSARPPQ